MTNYLDVCLSAPLFVIPLETKQKQIKLPDLQNKKGNCHQSDQDDQDNHDNHNQGSRKSKIGWELTKTGCHVQFLEFS